MQKVFVIEDEKLLRDLLLEVLRADPTLDIVGSVGDGQEGYTQCLKSKPHMVILDVLLPSLNGIEIASRLKAEMPWIKILIFSAVFKRGILRKILKCKVNGIVEKSAGLDELDKAIQAVASGQSYFSPYISQLMSELVLDPTEDDALEALTKREREVMQLIAEGHTTKEIATMLYISQRTAETHRNNLMQKLDLRGVAAITRFAIANGLVETPHS